MQDSGYNVGTAGGGLSFNGGASPTLPVDDETGVPVGNPSFFPNMSIRTFLKRLHQRSGLGRKRATSGARAKPKGYRAKKKRVRQIAAESRKRNRG